MASIFKDINDGNKMILLPNMTDQVACDKMVKCIMNDGTTEKLVELVYLTSVDYVKKTWESKIV